MKSQVTVFLILAAAILLSGCTFSTAGLEIQPSFASDITHTCGAKTEATTVDTFTGVDADGTTLSFWTPTFKGIQTAIEEAGQLCPQLGAEDISILWPEYRCQFRINIDMKAAACQLPE